VQLGLAWELWRRYEAAHADKVVAQDHPEDGWDYLAAIDLLAKALAENGRVDEAEPLVRPRGMNQPVPVQALCRCGFIPSRACWQCW